MNPGEHRESRSAGLAGRDEGRAAELLARGATQSAAVQRGCSAPRMPHGLCPRGSRSPWMNPGEHRESRSAGLARRDEGRAAELLARGATQRAAVQRGCSAPRMPHGLCPRGSRSPWMNPGEHRESRSAGLARRDEGRAAELLARGATQRAAVQRGCSAPRMPHGLCPRGSRSPWMNPGEHRETRSAGLARRDEGRAAELPARGATQRAAVQRGCSAPRMPHGLCPRGSRSPWMNPGEHRESRSAGLARRDEGRAAELLARGATQRAAVQRGCSAPRMPHGLCPRGSRSPWMNPGEHRESRSAGLARRDEGRAAELLARGATQRAAVQRGCSAPRMPHGLCPRGSRSPWMNPGEHRESRSAGLARRDEGRAAELLARGATQRAAVQRGCSAPRMPHGLCPRAPRSPRTASIPWPSHCRPR